MSVSQTAIAASAAVQRVNARSKRNFARDPGAISLIMGDPDFETPPHVREALTQAVNQGYTHYADGAGDPELRAAIAQDVSVRAGVEYRPEQILVTHGGTGGLAATFLGLLDAGDRLLVPQPTYSLYGDLAAWVGAELVDVDLGPDLHLDLDALRRAAPGAKLLVICNPGNPTGAVLRRDELEAVGEIARQHNLLVVADEAYDHIVYDGYDFVSALQIEGLQGRLVYCQTFSKVLSMTGWRIGYLAGPPEVIAAAGRVVRTLLGPINAAVQRAALVAFTTPSDWPERMRQEYQYRRDLVLETLDGLPGVDVHTPEGTFYAFIRVPEGRTSTEIVDAARARGVLIRGGAEYGPAGEGFVRLAFSSSRKDLETALPVLREVLSGRGVSEAARAEPIAAMEPALERVLAHPFLRGIADGSLERARFGFFTVQDALYLRDYARALAILGTRAPDEASLLLFARHAIEALEVERALHTELFAALGIDAGVALAAEPAPTCLAYTSYLLRVVQGGSFAEGLGAILPCYWIYGEVGGALLAAGSPDPVCRRWIEAYADPAYGAVVEEVLQIVDRIWPGLGAGEQARALAHVRYTSRYEWCFWEMAWRQEAWPV